MYCFRQTVEGQRDVVDALREELEGIQVAAGDLLSFVDDEDVIAEFFRFAENLRRQYDGSSLLDFGAKEIHHLALQDGIHPRRKLVEEQHRRLDHEHLGNLHAAAESAAQVLDLAFHFRAELKLVQQGTRAASRRCLWQTLKARVGEQIVPDGKKQLDGCFLNHRGNPFPDFDRLFHDIVAEDLRGAFGRQRERREHAQQS